MALSGLVNSCTAPLNTYLEYDIETGKLIQEKDPWETGLSFATIVWRLRTDGTGGYDYVNGYVSPFKGNQ